MQVLTSITKAITRDYDTLRRPYVVYRNGSAAYRRRNRPSWDESLWTQVLFLPLFCALVIVLLCL